MAQPQVSIIGAGIAGLVLGRCLLRRGIPAVLYERDSAKPRHAYGITLRSSAYQQLLPILELDENTFIRKLAVDGAVGGQGRESPQTPPSSSFRANRQRFEELLREGLDVRWEHKVRDVTYAKGSLSLSFENGHAAESRIVVGADGVHSQLRKIISPETEFNILPFAVYNGKRRLDPDTFEHKYASNMKDATVLSQKSSSALLQVSINDITDERASISYTYSRAAPQSDDALFRPKRPISGATDMPSELFEEVNSLGDLQEPFKAVFDSESMKNDRLLNWLMRSVLVPQNDLNEAATNSMVLLGDAVRCGPILGSEGANEAIEDAVGLADHLASEKEMQSYYQQRHSTWAKSVNESEARLTEMHKNAKSSL